MSRVGIEVGASLLFENEWHFLAFEIRTLFNWINLWWISGHCTNVLSRYLNDHVLNTHSNGNPIEKVHCGNFPLSLALWRERNIYKYNLSTFPVFPLIAESWHSKSIAYEYMDGKTNGTNHWDLVLCHNQTIRIFLLLKSRTNSDPWCLEFGLLKLFLIDLK